MTSIDEGSKPLTPCPMCSRDVAILQITLKTLEDVAEAVDNIATAATGVASVIRVFIDEVKKAEVPAFDDSLDLPTSGRVD